MRPPGRRRTEGVGEEIEEHLADALLLECHRALALGRVRELTFMVLCEHARVLGKRLQECGRPLFLQVHGNRLRIGTRQEEQLVNDAVHTG